MAGCDVESICLCTILHYLSAEGTDGGRPRGRCYLEVLQFGFRAWAGQINLATLESPGVSEGAHHCLLYMIACE